MTTSVHLSGDLSAGGLVRLVVLPVEEIVSEAVTVAGVALTHVAPSIYRIPPGATAGAPIVASANGSSRTLSVRMIEQLAQLRGEVLGHAGVAGGPDEPHRRAGFDLVAYFG